jgi:hypothetical protein
MLMHLFQVVSLGLQQEHLHLWLEHKMSKFLIDAKPSYKEWVKTFLTVENQVEDR